MPLPIARRLTSTSLANAMGSAWHGGHVQAHLPPVPALVDDLSQLDGGLCLLEVEHATAFEGFYSVDIDPRNFKPMCAWEETINAYDCISVWEYELMDIPMQSKCEGGGGILTHLKGSCTVFSSTSLADFSFPLYMWSDTNWQSEGGRRYECVSMTWPGCKCVPARRESEATSAVPTDCTPVQQANITNVIDIARHPCRVAHT